MNKEKVRIYELSKELELENKEILEICSELSIIAKSHSSTITESQAESIRAVAQKHISSHKHQLKDNQQAETGDAQFPMSQSSEAKKTHLKQEILAIHKHHRPLSSESQSGQEIKDSPILLTPPRPVEKPESSSEQITEEKEANQGTSVQLKTPPPQTNFSVSTSTAN